MGPALWPRQRSVMPDGAHPKLPDRCHLILPATRAARCYPRSSYHPYRQRTGRRCRHRARRWPSGPGTVIEAGGAEKGMRPARCARIEANRAGRGARACLLGDCCGERHGASQNRGVGRRHESRRGGCLHRPYKLVNRARGAGGKARGAQVGGLHLVGADGQGRGREDRLAIAAQWLGPKRGSTGTFLPRQSRQRSPRQWSTSSPVGRPLWSLANPRL